MKKLIVIIFLISSTAFGQILESNTLNEEYLIKYADCLIPTFYLGNGNDITVSILKAHLKGISYRKNDYFIKSSEAKYIEFIKILSNNSVLKEVYKRSTKENSFEGVESGKIIKAYEVSLFLQIDFFPNCKNDSLFILITDSLVAKNIISELRNLYRKNRGFKKLYKNIKT